MSGKVYVDPLFVGLTRPPLLFGVSYTVVMLNGFCGMISYITTEDIKFMLMILPIHMLAFFVSSKEPLFLDLFRVKNAKCGQCSNKMFYKEMGNSYDPI